MPNLTHDEKIEVMGEQLLSSYDDRLEFLRDNCRAYGTRPVPWNSFNIPDQIGRSAAYQTDPEWFVKLASEPENLTALEKAGFCFLIREHPKLSFADFNGAESDLCAILNGALEVSIDPDSLSKILLWFAMRDVKGAANVIEPFVIGERELKFPFDGGSFENHPSPHAIAALALALLGDPRAVDPINGALKRGQAASPDRSARLLGLAHAQGKPQLFTLKDYAWDTFHLYEAVNALARKHPSRHSYDLLVIGGTLHSWAIVNQESVIAFQQLTGQKWFKDRENERADWYGKDARAWWANNRATYKFTKR